MDRRSALKAIGILAGTAAFEGCAAKHVASVALPPPPSQPTPLKLPKVNVAPDREIRTVVGLRPFRPSGFVVAAQKFDDKLVVHNYGHGGGGVTLSWGTGALACREVDASEEKNIGVLGCGAVGLATARLLQERGRNVTIYAKDLPPNTTSNVAGAQWFPVNVFQRNHAAPDFMPRFVEASRLANRRYQLMVGARYGIRWMPNYLMDQEPMTQGGLHSFDSPIRDLLPEMRDLEPAENPFPFPYVRQFQTMMIEPNTYLPAMLQDFRIADGRIEVREIRDLAELQTLPERVIVNCSGLGAKALFNDEELTPVKGQLTFLLPQTEVQYCTLPPDLYMFPRSDGIALGGTHEPGVWSLEPDLQAKQRIIAGHARIFHDMR
jgi:glycine/D-amino acid oxidase-like deaminating enzyme